MFLSSKQLNISKYSKFRPLKENRKFQGVGGVIGICGGVCGEQLMPRTLDLDVWGSSLARRIVSLDKELYSTLFLLIQVYKWVPATYCWGVTLRLTSIPSRGE